MIKVGKISHKDDILTVFFFKAYIENNKKIYLEMTPRKTELEARRLKAANMRIKKRIEKEKHSCRILVENMLKVLTSEAYKSL